MSVSFVSKIIEPSPYIAPVDSEVYRSALLYKQQKYDQGVQLVDSEIKNLSQYDILHPEKQKYFQQKMQGVVDQVNKMGGMDFGDRSTLQQISSFTSQIAADPVIAEGIAETRAIRGQQALIEKYKSDPKKYAGIYSPINEWDFSRQVSDYVNSKSADGTGSGVKWNGATYQQFKDVPGLLGKKIKEIQDTIIKGGGYKYTDGNGYFHEIKSLDNNRIEQAARAELQSNPELYNQVLINSRFGAGNYLNDPERFKRDYAEKLSRQVDYYSQAAKARDNEYTVQLAKIPKDSEQYKRVKEQWDAEKAQFNSIRDSRIANLSRIRTGQVSAEELYRDSYTEGLINNLTNQYTFKSEKLSADPAWMQNQRLQFDKYKEGWDQKMDVKDYELKLQDIELKKQRLLLDQQKAAQELEVKTGLKTKADGTLGTDDYGVVTLPVDVIAKNTLDTMGAEIKAHQEEQVGILKNAVIQGIAATNRTLAETLQSQFQVEMNPDGTIKSTKAGKNTVAGIPPMLLKVVQQGQDMYNAALRGKQLSPQQLEQLSPELRDAYTKIQKNTLIINQERKRYESVQQEINKIMPVQEYNRMMQLEKKIAELRDPTNPEYFNSPHVHELVMQYDRLKEKYNNSKQQVEDVISRSGTQRYGIRITGEKLKDQFGTSNQLLKNSIQNELQNPKGLTNSELSTQNAELQNTDFNIEAVVVDPYTKKIKVDVSYKVGTETRNLRGLELDFSQGQPEYYQIVPQEFLKSATSLDTKLLHELNTTGGLGKGSNRIFYSTQGNVIVGASPVKRLGGSDYGVYFTSPEGEYTHYINDTAFQTNPIGWMETSYSNWMTNTVLPYVKKEYGKGNPNYVLTIADVIKFLKKNS